MLRPEDPEARLQIDSIGGAYLTYDKVRSNIPEANQQMLLARTGVSATRDNEVGQQDEALAYLASVKWLSETVQAISLDYTIGTGYAFADPERLKKLERWGHLVLMGST